MTIRQIITELHRQLFGQYPETEIESFSRILFKHYLDMTQAQTHLSRDSELPAQAEKSIREAIVDLKKYRPIQYILGETEFYGLRFELTPDVLIPRPETEELVDWIVRQYDRNADLTMIDIGTGSGCIAVALSANFPNANVWAVDVCEAALAVARRNALKNGVKVNFLMKDVLTDGMMNFEPASLDTIVSNPPYVAPSEKEQLSPNVLEYEPHCALFTPDNHPLIFYEHIAAFGLKCLKNKGKIFFEINEAFPEKVAGILRQNHYSNITTRKDVNGKVRMASAEREINESNDAKRNDP